MKINLIKKKFIIKFRDGLLFAKRSKDFNPIHIDKKYAYNSYLGKNVAHGVLVILFFFKKLNINKNLDIKTFETKFLKPVEYNKKIIIRTYRKKNKFYFNLIQNNIIVTEFSIKIFDDKKNNLIKFLNPNLNNILEKISYYVGMRYPGKNSLLQSIKIETSEKNFKYFKIQSELVDQRLPIIKNYLNFKNFKIEFTSLFRPVVIKKRIRPNKLLLKKVQQIKNNILILGASQGIGNDLLNLLKLNKKITIIGTYFNNKIHCQNKKIKFFKINIQKNINQINKIIKKYSPIKIYYFISPKIIFDNKISKEKKIEFEKFFLKKPLEILKKNKFNKISFFYPSTDFINFNLTAPYSKIKKDAEIKLKNFTKLHNIRFNFIRFPAINSRQSISLSNPSHPSLNEFLNNNNKNIEKILLLN